MPIIEIHITQTGIRATGLFDTGTEKVTICAGSILGINLAKTPATNIAQNYDRAREAVRIGDIVSKSGVLHVVNPITNQSPSGAWVIVSGKAGSGWEKWIITETGQLLDVLRRPGGSAPTKITPAAEPPPSNSNTSAIGVGCECDCKNPCDKAEWTAASKCFWSRVWRRPPVHSAFSTVLPAWVSKALSVTKPQFKNPPTGGTWAVGAKVKCSMTGRLEKFFHLDWPIVAKNTPGDFLVGPWRNLLEGLNADAAKDPTLFWGEHSGPIYGRSQKLASLIGKYLMVQSLLLGDVPMFEQLAELLPPVVDRKGTLELLRKNGFRVFMSGSTWRPWTSDLRWDDYTQILDAVKELAGARCCKSPAIYELCHIW